ncbi:major facilitator superfamily domain-containing protein [Dactylonectria macrodidyma]|uniref:Major facilitator superfamily domain-containing protein n=1 Tax=Dactylonectria macrodidyma TaxID=307937 RepID=A0A9P9DH46_9HYPO|nr:major facilitator superfamily domain-containing protein [Dactylonectria macrodidyma]
MSRRARSIFITTYLILQAIAPTFTAQWSDTVGRRPLYMSCFVIFAAANIGLGMQDNYVALLVLRCSQSAGGSGNVALSNAVATDITTPSERGSYIAYASAIPMLGSTLVWTHIRRALAQRAGWHSVFWLLLGLTGAIAIPMALFFPEICRECYTNVRIERIALQQGIQVPYDKRDKLAKSRHVAFPNPFASVMLLLQRECGFALLYNSILCCSFYAILSLIPSQFHKVYDFSELHISLCYIPFGRAHARSNFRRHATRLGLPTEKNRQTNLAGFPIEHARLEVAFPTIVLGSACLIGFGWTLHYRTNLAGPLILLFVIALCLSASLNCVSCLMLDLYPDRAGTVSASNNLLRCLMGAGATAVIVPMIDGIGNGWALTIFGLLNVPALPLLWYIMKHGPNWRAEMLKRESESKTAGTNCNEVIDQFSLCFD